MGDTKAGVIAQLSSQLLDERALSDRDSPTLPDRSDVYSSIQSAATTAASTEPPEGEVVPCVELDRYAPPGTAPEKAKIRYFLFDVEGCIIDSVPAQIKTFREAILQIHQEYLFEQAKLLSQQLCGVTDERARILEQQIKKLSETAAKLRYLTDQDYHDLISGRDREDGFRNFLGISRKRDASREEDELIVRLCKKKDALFQQMLVDNQIKAFPAAIEMLKELHRRCIKLAFASGSSNAARLLFNADVLHLFEVGVQKGRGGHSGKYVTMPRPAGAKLAEGQQEFSDDLFRACDVKFTGKPLPWIFYKTAHKMGANPYECAVVEDSPQLIHQYYEAGFGAAIGIDTGGAFKKEAVRAGTVFYREEGESPKHVTNSCRIDIVSKITTTKRPRVDVYEPVHTTHPHRDHADRKVFDPALFGGSSSSDGKLKSQVTVEPPMPSTRSEGEKYRSPSPLHPQ